MANSHALTGYTYIMRNAKNEPLGFLCLLGAIGLWSTVEVVTRTIHAEVQPIQLAWIRFLIGGTFLLCLLPSRLRQRRLKLDRSILLFAMLVCWPGVVVSNIALQYSLTTAGAAVVATVYGTAPLFVLGLSRVILGDPLTVPRFSGLVCGVLGIAVLSLGKPSPDFSLLGVGCAVLAAGSFSVWTVLVKKSAGPYAGLPVTALCCAFGVLFMTPMAWLENDGFNTPALIHNATAVLYLAIGGTGIAYWLYFTGLEHVDATRAMSVILLKPPAAAVLAAIFLGEKLTWNIVIAMGLILLALYGVFIWDRRRVVPPRAGAV